MKSKTNFSVNHNSHDDSNAKITTFAVADLWRMLLTLNTIHKKRKDVIIRLFKSRKHIWELQHSLNNLIKSREKNWRRRRNKIFKWHQFIMYSVVADYIRHMISIYYFKTVLNFTGKITGKFLLNAMFNLMNCFWECSAHFCFEYKQCDT